MKKILVAFIILLTFSFLNMAYALDTSIYVNGERLDLPQKPKMEKGTTLVPMRPIFEALGAKVTWNSLNMEVEAEKEDLKIKLPVGKKVAIKNGYLYELPIATTIEKGHTLVPLRFVSEALGADVGWDKDSGIVTINTTRDKVIEDTKQVLDTVNLAKKAKHVVMVLTYDQNDNLLTTASGVVIGPGGLIATNYHVIEGASQGLVITDLEESYQVLGVAAYDPSRDLAILKVDADLPSSLMGDSMEVKIGDPVISIGSPLGIKNTVTSGMVSNLIELNGQSFIQTTTPIAQGSSGGALFNANGELIGITTAYLASGQNINLAIPINDLKDLNEHSLEELLTLDTLSSKASSYGLITATEDLVSFLNDNYGVINEDNLIRFSYLAADRTLYDFEIDVLIDPLDYGNWLELDNQDKLKIIGSILKAVDLNVDLRNSFRLTFYYQDYWPFYPSSFEGHEIDLGPDGESWLVTHIIAKGYTIQDSLKWEVYN